MEENNDKQYNLKSRKTSLLQVRLELTTPALLVLYYKYRALTDCATGALE